METVCPYLREYWDEVRAQSGFTTLQIVRRWKHRLHFAQRCLPYTDRKKRMRNIAALRLDNPYASPVAYRLMVLLAVKSLRTATRSAQGWREYLKRRAA